MQNKNYKIRILVFIVFGYIFLNSCKKNVENKEIKDKFFNIKYSLPDTLSITDTLNGKLYYMSKFDTVILKQDESRYVFLYLNVTDEVTSSYEEFLKKPFDTFVPLNNDNKVYDINNIKFNKIGNQYIDGYIIDELWLNRNSSENYIKIPVIESKFVHPIYIKN